MKVTRMILHLLLLPVAPSSKFVKPSHGKREGSKFLDILYIAL